MKNRCEIKGSHLQSEPFTTGVDRGRCTPTIVFVSCILLFFLTWPGKQACTELQLMPSRQSKAIWKWLSVICHGSGDLIESFHSAQYLYVNSLIWLVQLFSHYQILNKNQSYSQPASHPAPTPCTQTKNKNLLVFIFLLWIYSTNLQAGQHTDTEPGNVHMAHRRLSSSPY